MLSSASRVILIRPTGFGYDPGTAATNAFQQHTGEDVRASAAAEFDALLLALDRCGIGTTVLDPTDPEAPNGVFPNNWCSTHADGTLVLYPMCTPSRRAERDPAFAQVLEREGFRVRQTLDLSAWEKHDLILEGTGSLVLDRPGRKAFACLSPRTSENALNAWCEQLGYAPHAFLATMDGTLTGQPVYHTNVVMAIGEDFAVVCFEAMPYPADRADIRAELERSGKTIIAISLAQLHAFVGNLLAVRTPKGGPHVFLSETAFSALVPEQRLQLERLAQLMPVPVPVIERVGGGSVRCMLLENFLPVR